MDDILFSPIETLEMCNGYEHYEIVSAYRNRASCLMVLRNTLNSMVTCEEVSLNGRDDKGVIIVRPKKRKKTFIKTLKELVDSGWTFGEDGCLHFPDSNFAVAPRMSAFLGQEIDYSPSSPQGIWTWTPEMLIEKEV